VLAQGLTFSPDCDESFFAEFPARAAVFALRGEGEPYISKTANLRRRLQRLLPSRAEPGKRLNLRQRVRQIEFTATGSDFESQFLLYNLLRENFPQTYAARLRLRPAPLVKLHLKNAYPRVSVTTRLGKLASVGGTPAHRHISTFNAYYGPFPSRMAAEKLANDVLDFFKMRRCVEDLHPDPSFPGCVYSEMKMCLAPCFKGCSDEEYRAEVEHVQNFFESRGESLARQLAEERDRASSALAFEEAAAVHARLEKLKSVIRQAPEIVRRIEKLDAVIIHSSADPDCVCLFRFWNAQLTGPIAFNIANSAVPDTGIETKGARPVTMEARIADAIRAFPEPEAPSTKQSAEHLALLKRWYYRSSRVGEIFFADEKGAWPLRRIPRGIARVHRGEKAVAQDFATEAPGPPSQPE
jgi:excinuclease ABC subunit C